MGAQVPSGHRSAPTEPAGETVPPKAAEGISFQKIPTPCPLPLLQYVQERASPQREGEFYFSFPKGAVGPLGIPLLERESLPP